MGRLGPILFCAVLCACSDDAPARESLDGAVDARVEARVDASLDAALDAWAPREDAHVDADVAADASAPGPLRVLVFTRTLGFRHDSIPASITALQGLASEHHWQVTASEDPAVFSDAGLAPYDVIAFVSTSGDILDASQQDALERFVRGGKGWVGVHAASDTEYDWPWYGGLVGAFFQVHPAIQPATLRVERTSHLASRGLPATWQRTDEWYSFRTNPRADLQVLLSLDEDSYQADPGRMGDHPVAWYHHYEGGRAFYSALGHTIESWSEPAFLSHIAGAIDWAGGEEVALVADFEGASVPPWQAHTLAGGFDYEVQADALRMTDRNGANQHLVRAGVAVDAQRPYALEALFTVTSTDPSGLNSFCFNLNVAGSDLSPPSTWASNVDFNPTPPGAVMKHMGFVNGAFGALGETVTTWGARGTEYLLRSEVGVRLDGTRAPSFVTNTVRERGVIRERFEVDYASFAYQPNRMLPVRIGVNTHGTDWAMRSFRAHYLD
ncbi:MAG: ThuA domain-containing protein [Polyangiales bacterium]